MNKIPLIIDCDPGIDDAFAIFLANSIKKFDIKAITSVSGNVNIDYTTRNMLLLANLLDLDCILARGKAEPLVKPRMPAMDVHGNDGFGGCLHLFLEESKRGLSGRDAVTVLRETIMNSRKKVTIAAIGPLTNIALLLKCYPEVKENIEVISIMGGAIDQGNITPCSEFNFYVDPEAASIIFNSGLPLIMSGINLTVNATLTEDNLNEMKSIGTKLSDIGVQMVTDYIPKDSAIHDPCAILAISNPEIFESKDLYVQVDTREGTTRGMSYADYRGRNANKPNCKVLTKMDVDKFRKYVVDSLRFGL